MKKIIVLTAVFILSSCNFVGEEPVVRNQIYNFVADENEIYHFEYPDGAKITSRANGGRIFFKDCEFDFSEGESNLNPVEFILVEGVENVFCTEALENMKMTLTDDYFYINDDYSYKVRPLDEYKLEFLPSGEGINMIKWVQPDPPTKEELIEMDDDWDPRFDGYTVEIMIKASENFMNYEGLNEFLNDKYQGYSLDFGFNGVFVNESVAGDSIRHFFIMDKGEDYLYEAALKVPSYHYSEHKEVLDEVLESFTIL